MKHLGFLISESKEDEDISCTGTPVHRPNVRNPGQVLPVDNDDGSDTLSALQKKSDELSLRRSRFVRMVSDPKLYNPKIVKTRTPGIKARPSFPPMDGQNASANGNGQIPQQPSPSSSWISWPLAFMFQDNPDEENPVSFRFRNWESTLSIKPGPGGSSNRTSPDNEFLKPTSPNRGRRSRSPSAAGRAGAKSPNTTGQ